MRGLSFLLIGAICWVFWTGPCPGQSAGPSPHSLAKSEKELKDFLLRYVKERGDDGSTTRYFDAFFDLNADGTKEAIVHLIGHWWCGTGGCPTLILAPDGPSYRVIATVLATFRRKNEALSLFDPVAAAMGPCKIVHFPAPKHF